MRPRWRRWWWWWRWNNLRFGIAFHQNWRPKWRRRKSTGRNNNDNDVKTTWKDDKRQPAAVHVKFITDQSINTTTSRQHKELTGICLQQRKEKRFNILSTFSFLCFWYLLLLFGFRWTERYTAKALNLYFFRISSKSKLLQRLPHQRSVVCHRTQLLSNKICRYFCQSVWCINYSHYLHRHDIDIFRRFENVRHDFTFFFISFLFSAEMKKPLQINPKPRKKLQKIITKKSDMK